MKKNVIILLSVLICVMLSACGCSHRWTEADCQSPKVCSICGKTNGEALGHDWIEASCDSAKTCSRCKVTEGAALEHDWDTENGVIKCRRCGKIDESKNALYLSDKISEEEKEKYLDIENQNNIQNSAGFLSCNGWIYGHNFDENGNSLFTKVRTDGNDYTVLDKGYASYIQIVDNYIYYMIINDSTHEIRRMKTSGEDKKTIVKAYGGMQIKDGYIYYSDQPTTYSSKSVVDQEDAHLFRCSLSGKNKVEIIKKPTYHFYVFDNGILYQDDKDNSSLHKCSLDGSNDLKINDRISYWPLYDGEFIYYISEAKLSDNQSRTIRKVRPDGTQDQLVSSCKVSYGLIMRDHYLYFVNADDNDRIYRIEKDGTELSLITQDADTGDIQFLGNKLKYTKYTKDGYVDNIYVCNPDGSGKTDISNSN